MKATTMRSLRKWHHYLGVFFAPMILLFAVSGALQTFRLQEAGGYGGPPPNWIVWLASVHKDQGPPREAKPKPAASPAPKNRESADAALRGKRPSPLPLKIFVVLLAASLALSTVLGVIIALNNRAMRTTSLALLVAGAVLPCVLLWL